MDYTAVWHPGYNSIDHLNLRTVRKFAQKRTHEVIKVLCVQNLLLHRVLFWRNPARRHLTKWLCGSNMNPYTLNKYVYLRLDRIKRPDRYANVWKMLFTSVKNASSNVSPIHQQLNKENLTYLISATMFNEAHQSGKQYFMFWNYIILWKAVR